MPKSKEKCQEQRDKTRAAILQKSCLYFAKNGFAGTKIGDLSKHIGIAAGTIYIYFESKEALFREIINITNYDDELGKLKVLTMLPIPAKDKLLKMSKSILSMIEKDEMYAARIALNTQLILESGEESSLCIDNQQKLYSYTRKIIRQGQKEQTFAKGSADKLADYYWSVVYVYALKRLFTNQYDKINAKDLSRVLMNSEVDK